MLCMCAASTQTVPACCVQACNRMHVRTGSHLQRELLAAEDDAALLALIRRAARQQRCDIMADVIPAAVHLLTGTQTRLKRMARW